MLTATSRFDASKPSLVLYLQVTLGNRLFGHTLREIYLPFFRRLADEQGWNLVYVSFLASGPTYVQKQTGLFDAIFTLEADEERHAPYTYRELFEGINLSQLSSLKVAKLVSLCAPLVIRDSARGKDYQKLLDVKQSTMLSISKAWVDLLGGAWLADALNQPLHHVIVDPLEASYADLKGFTRQGRRLFLYESPTFSAEALHVCEQTYRRLHAERRAKPRLFDVEKELDIVIGYSITQKPRLWLQEYDFERSLKGSGLSYGLFVRDNYRDIDTFLWDKTAYLSMLESSRYTLIIPSYDVRAFSTIRFTEALYSGSIPLLLDKCNLSEVFTSRERELLAPLVVSDKNLADVIKATDYEVKLSELQTWFLEQKPLQVMI